MLKHYRLILALSVGLAAVLATDASPALGANFSVNSTGNQQDASTGDGVCDTDTGTIGDQCTLRAAIEQANNDLTKDTITFNIPTSDPGYDVNTDTFRIQPDSPLPLIGSPVVINGRSQPEFADRPVIELNGLSAGVLASGLRITAGNSEVRGLVINKFGQTNSANGIRLEGPGGGNIIEGNYIGVDVTGSVTEPNLSVAGDEFGNSGSGIFISGSANNTIGGARSDETCLGATNPCNIISGAGRGLSMFSDAHGVEIAGAGATGNVVKGNIIGLDVGGGETGPYCLDNTDIDSDGYVNDGCPESGSAPESGPECALGNNSNDDAGDDVLVNDGCPAILGARKDLSNEGDGVRITGVSNNTIGGGAAGEGNVITTNESDGVEIKGGPEAGNACTNANDDDGDGFVNDGCPQSGTTAESGIQCINSTNDDSGDDALVNDGCAAVQVASGNLLEGNLIGTTSLGTTVPPPGSSKSFYGVLIDGAPNNLIGVVGGAPNVSSGNQFGMQIQGNSATGNLVRRNYVGTDVTGSIDLGNQASGIVVGSSTAAASNNTIGGTAAGSGNVVSGNDQQGILIDNATSTGNLVQGNYIGTDATGAIEIGNGTPNGASTGRGIKINNAQGNTIGGTAAGRNVLSGNIRYGVEVVAVTPGAAGNNVIQSNYIGTNAAGTAALGNRDGGVVVSSAPNTQIGGTAIAERNLISGNGYWRTFIVVASGIAVLGGPNGTASGTQVQGNLIGTNFDGTTALGNGGDGIVIVDATNITVGGTSASARNIISGNGVHGVEIDDLATGNLVKGNYIGLNIGGNAGMANGGNGVFISDAAGNVIGGTAAGSANVVSGNGSMGIEILGVTASANYVQGNLIGTDATGAVDLGNAQHGVFVNGAPNNVIGGTSAAARNVISGNGTGVFVQNGGAIGNLVQGNRIGTNAAGSAALGNTFDGVRIGGNAAANSVGGSVNGAGNTIANNGANGVVVDSGTGNSILSNSIANNGSPAGLGIELGLDGQTTNDSGDGDSGPNNLQNYPVVASATGYLVSTTVSGSLNSTPSTSFTLQVFASPTCDPPGPPGSGFGEGVTFLGSFSVTTNGAGNATFINQSLPSGGTGGQQITATATDPGGNTSEFSQCRLAGTSNDQDQDTVPDVSDNCPLTPNTNQTNTDGDSQGDACDLDDDNDKVYDVDEQNCGGNALNLNVRPERTDGIFAGVSDDGDAQVDESLPAGSQNYDCDGDGFKGTAESHVGTSNQDACGNNGWPADLVSTGASTNKLDITDLASFVTGTRKLGTSLGDNGYNVRWDVVPGSSFGKHINLQDVAALITGGSGYPPMFNGTRAFNQVCPWAP